MRFKAKVDSNQADIVKNLRKIGLSVIHLHREGGGVPDILVSNSTDMWLVEIKVAKNKKGEASNLTPDQKKFHGEWKGKPIIIGTSFEEIYEKIRG